LKEDNNNKKRNDRKFFVGAQKPVSVIYVEVYVNPTAEGKNTPQQRVQFINISQIVEPTGFRQDSLFCRYCLFPTRATAKCWFLQKMVIVKFDAQLLAASARDIRRE
jgi:hypothetical protein